VYRAKRGSGWSKGDDKRGGAYFWSDTWLTNEEDGGDVEKERDRGGSVGKGRTKKRKPRPRSGSWVPPYTYGREKEILDEHYAKSFFGGGSNTFPCRLKPLYLEKGQAGEEGRIFGGKKETKACGTVQKKDITCICIGQRGVVCFKKEIASKKVAEAGGRYEVPRETALSGLVCQNSGLAGRGICTFWTKMKEGAYRGELLGREEKYQMEDEPKGERWSVANPVVLKGASLSMKKGGRRSGTMGTERGGGGAGRGGKSV